MGQSRERSSLEDSTELLEVWTFANFFSPNRTLLEDLIEVVGIKKTSCIEELTDAASIPFRTCCNISLGGGKHLELVIHKCVQHLFEAATFFMRCWVWVWAGDEVKRKTVGHRRRRLGWHVRQPQPHSPDYGRWMFLLPFSVAHIIRLFAIHSGHCAGVMMATRETGTSQPAWNSGYMFCVWNWMVLLDFAAFFLGQLVQMVHRNCFFSVLENVFSDLCLSYLYLL